jgi:hypothetical protein
MKTLAIENSIREFQSSSDSWFQCGPSGGYVEQLSTSQLWDLMGIRSNVFDNDPADIISDYETWEAYGEEESFI